MNVNKFAKYIAIAFAVIIVILLAILVFVNPPHRAASVPTSSPQNQAL